MITRYLLLICLLSACSQRPVSSTVYFNDNRLLLKRYISGDYDLISQIVDDCYGNHDTMDIRYMDAWINFDTKGMICGDRLGQMGPYKWERQSGSNKPILRFRTSETPQSRMVYVENRASYQVNGWVPIWLRGDTLAMYRLDDDGYHSPTIIKNYYKRVNKTTKLVNPFNQ